MKFVRSQVEEERSWMERILLKLISDGSFEIDTETDEEELSEDWKNILEPLRKPEEIYIRPYDYVGHIEYAISSLCRKILGREISYPATWENMSSMELYYCTSPKEAFITVSVDSDPDSSFTRFTVDKTPEDAARTWNFNIDTWIDRLMDYASMDVEGAEESEELAKALEDEKITAKDIRWRLKEIFKR